jgi:phenylalanyl-tRNA synthetase beta subunit
VSAGQLRQCVTHGLTGTHDRSVNSLEKVPARLVDVKVFDVYRGKGVTTGHKSVAFNVTVEPHTRTLTEKDIQLLTNAVIEAVAGELKGELRGG